jgi:hypothetical protein
MTTDDRDTESQNPSKSFKVGEFDRLSGFFTPVWESKRRIRSESPIPSSAAPASSKTAPAPAEAGTADAVVPPKVGSVPPPRPGRVVKAPAAQEAAKLASPQTGGPAAVHEAIREPSAGLGSVSVESAAARASTLKPAALAHAASALTLERTGTPEVPGATAQRAPTQVSAKGRAQGPSGAPLPGTKTQLLPDFANPRVTTPEPPAQAARPVIPMPRASQLPAARSKPPSIPPSAPATPEHVLAQLPADAFLDPEPDFRVPVRPQESAARAERPTLHYRALRATAAATAVHEQLKSKLQADATETAARYRETDSDREAWRAVAAATLAKTEDPYPLQLLRRLRRTIHLSAPLPESIRSVLSKYSRN